MHQWFLPQLFLLIPPSGGRGCNGLPFKERNVVSYIMTQAGRKQQIAAFVSATGGRRAMMLVPPCEAAQ